MPAAADVLVSFEDRAPTDRITVVNDAECALGPFTLLLDLEPAPTGLFFDVALGGAGVGVVQPLRIVEGADAVLEPPIVLDGDRLLGVTLRGLAPGGQVVFTVDVDDRAAAGVLGQTRVAGSEMAGALARVSPISAPDRAAEALFEADGAARVPLPDCGPTS